MACAFVWPNKVQVYAVDFNLAMSLIEARAYVLLNLSNELRKNDQMLAFYRFFRNELNKFNLTRPRMLNSIYHMTLKLLTYRIFGEKMS